MAKRRNKTLKRKVRRSQTRTYRKRKSLGKRRIRKTLPKKRRRSKRKRTRRQKQMGGMETKEAVLQTPDNPWDNPSNFNVLKKGWITKDYVWSNKEMTEVYKKKGDSKYTKEYERAVEAVEAGLAPRVIRDGKSKSGIDYFVSAYGGKNISDLLRDKVKLHNFELTDENKGDIIQILSKANELRKKIIKAKENKKIREIHGDFKLHNVVLNQKTDEMLAIDWDPLGMDWCDMAERFKHEFTSVFYPENKNWRVECEKLNKIWDEITNE